MRSVYTGKDKEEQGEMRVVLVSDEAVSCSEGFHREGGRYRWEGRRVKREQRQEQERTMVVCVGWERAHTVTHTRTHKVVTTHHLGLLLLASWFELGRWHCSPVVMYNTVGEQIYVESENTR